MNPAKMNKSRPLISKRMQAGFFSSFLFDYNMNLYEQQGKLSWQEFHRIIVQSIRRCPILIGSLISRCKGPKKDKYNEDEVRRIRAMKEKYGFKSERMKNRIREIEGKRLVKRMQEHTSFIKEGGKK